MLALTRLIGEIIDITVGDIRIEVMVTDVRGSAVRLGIQAPRDVTVHRREVTEAIEQEKTNA